MIQSTIKKKINVDIKDIKVQPQNIPKDQSPFAYFIASKEDKFVTFSHTEYLYNNYPGKK